MLHTILQFAQEDERVRAVIMNGSGRYGYRYPIEDDQRVTNYLHHIKALPTDATDIY